MKIGILGGTGALGQGLGARFVLAGHDVMVGSRQADRAEGVVEALKTALVPRPEGASGGSLLAGETSAVAAFGDLVVLATPARPDDGFFESLRPQLSGKILLDCTVQLDPNDITRVVPSAPATSVQIQAVLGHGVTVIAGLHTVAAAKLRSIDDVIREDTFVVGDDLEAKRTVIAVIESIGLRCFDAGSLDNGRTLERMTAMLIGMNKRYRRRGLTFGVNGI
jgi:8-hydroxy-5-deazaflavin:NADPH oxidoreductase